MEKIASKVHYGCSARRGWVWVQGGFSASPNHFLTTFLTYAGILVIASYRKLSSFPKAKKIAIWWTSGLVKIILFDLAHASY